MLSHNGLKNIIIIMRCRSLLYMQGPQSGTCTNLSVRNCSDFIEIQKNIESGTKSISGDYDTPPPLFFYFNESCSISFSFFFDVMGLVEDDRKITLTDTITNKSSTFLKSTKRKYSYKQKVEIRLN